MVTSLEDTRCVHHSHCASLSKMLRLTIATDLLVVNCDWGAPREHLPPFFGLPLCFLCACLGFFGLLVLNAKKLGALSNKRWLRPERPITPQSPLNRLPIAGPTCYHAQANFLCGLNYRLIWISQYDAIGKQVQQMSGLSRLCETPLRRKTNWRTIVPHFTSSAWRNSRSNFYRLLSITMDM